MWPRQHERKRAKVRLSAVAGRFYPRDAEELRATVERFIGAAEARKGPAPKAIIAPHAGYMFSGAVAGSAYAQFKPDAVQINRVVLLGPAHYVRFEGIAACATSAFLTPLGEEILTFMENSWGIGEAAIREEIYHDIVGLFSRTGIASDQMMENVILLTQETRESKGEVPLSIIVDWSLAKKAREELNRK